MDHGHQQMQERNSGSVFDVGVFYPPLVRVNQRYYQKSISGSSLYE